MKKAFNLSIAIGVIVALTLPIAALASNITTYTSGFQIQNLSSSEANVTIEFYNQDGSLAASPSDTIAANDSNTYFPLTAVSSGFNGSVVIKSDKEVAAIANVLGNDGAHGASYIGFSSGASDVNLPLVMKDNYGIDTWYNVQNTGGTDVTVTATYAGTSCTENATVKAYSAQTFDQSTNSCLSAGYVGAANLTSSGGSFVATVMQVTSDSSGLMPGLLAYNGFTTSSTEPVMPLVSSGYYNSGTGIQIQNTGSSSTDVTVTYSPSSGFPGASCTETNTITAGNSVTFGFPSMSSGCYTDGGSGGSAAFVGSAKVTGNSANQTLVAIVNQVTVGGSDAAAYGAFNPSDATAYVSLPLIMDRNYGIFTGFSVANVGSSATDISCTFSGTSYTVSATNVQPGEALTDVQLNKIADGYVGSALCQSTGENISAVVNQLNTGTSVAAEDGLLVSEGINYTP